MQPIDRVRQVFPEFSSFANLPALFNDMTLTDPILHYIRKTYEPIIKQKDINLYNELCNMQSMSPYTAKNFVDATQNIINRTLPTVISSPKASEIIQSLKSLHTVAMYIAGENPDLYTPQLIGLAQKIAEVERQSYTSNAQFQQLPVPVGQATTHNWVKHPPRFDEGKNENKADLSPMAQNGMKILNNNNNNPTAGGYGVTPNFQMPPQDIPQSGLSNSNNNNYQSSPGGFVNPPISPPTQLPPGNYYQPPPQQPQQPPLNSSYLQQPQQPPLNSSYPQQPPQQPLPQQYYQPPPQQQQYYPPPQQQQQQQQQQQPLQQSMYGMPRGMSSPGLPQKKVYPEYTPEEHYREAPPFYLPEELSKPQQVPVIPQGGFSQQPSNPQNQQVTQELYKGIELIEQHRIGEGITILERIYPYLEEKHKQQVLSIINKYKSK